jgi:hypothetical protein
MTISTKLKGRIKNGLVTIVVGLFIFIPMHVHALPLSFNNITNNNPGDAAIGESQLFVDVTPYGTNQVLFTFGNTGPYASSICDVYFDDGTLLEMASLIDADDGVGGDSNVDFTQSASPPDLPGGNNVTPPFITTAGFLADSDPEVQPNGVNPGESLGIIFNLQTGGTFSDVLAELGSGDLRIGIHVQGYASGGSESFVNSIPDATTLFLLGSACLIGFAGLRRKYRK